MLFRATVLALLGAIIAVELTGQVASIRRDALIARRIAHPRHVVMSPAVRPSLPDGTSVVDIRRDELDRMLADKPVASQARLVPSIRYGQPDGLRIFAIVPGSALETLGFQNGDHLLAVNDRPVDAGFDLGSSLAHDQFLDVALQRRGQRQRVVVLIH